MAEYSNIGQIDDSIGAQIKKWLPVVLILVLLVAAGIAGVAAIRKVNPKAEIQKANDYKIRNDCKQNCDKQELDMIGQGQAFDKESCTSQCIEAKNTTNNQ